MKHFIDLRGQETGHVFAFWDTVKNRFEEFSATQAWCSFRDFHEDYLGEHREDDFGLERYRTLCPEWMKEV